MILKFYIDGLRQLIPLERGRMDERLLIQFLNEQRSIALKNDFNAGRSIDDLMIQTFTVSVDLVSSNELGFDKDNLILKSQVKIPRTLDRHHSDTITSVRSPLIVGEHFNYIRQDQAAYAGNGMVNSREIYSFVYQDYMFIKLNKLNPKIKLISDITISGVFEDPREVYAITNGTDPMFMEYPIPIHTWTYIKELIVKQGLIGVEADEREEIK